MSSQPDPAVPRCPTPCDPDCEQPCHEIHAPRHKRGHNPGTCVGATVAGAVMAAVAAERKRLAALIEDSICAPGQQCDYRFCPDCIRYRQAQADAELVRKGGQP